MFILSCGQKFMPYVPYDYVIEKMPMAVKVDTTRIIK